MILNLFENWPEESHFGVALLDLVIDKNDPKLARTYFNQFLRNKEKTMEKYRGLLKESLIQLHKKFALPQSDLQTNDNQTEAQLFQVMMRRIDWGTIDPETCNNIARQKQLATLDRYAPLYYEGRIQVANATFWFLVSC